MGIKKKGLKLLASLMCLIAISSGISISAKEYKEEIKTVDIGYNFPVKPGTISWNALANTSERVKACQIPEEILKSLTTEQLIETVLNYPFLMDIYAYNTHQEGFDSVLKSFNGMSELLQRNDAATKLLAKYKSMQVLTDSTKITPENSSQVYDLSNIEIILHQYEIISKLSNTEKEELQNAINNKHLEKKKHKDIYGTSNGQAIKTSLELDSLVTPLTSTIVYTPKSTVVYVQINGVVYTPSQILANDNYVRQTYPGTTLLKSSTREYNCHSYAWYSQNTDTNKYWMDDPMAYMTDGSYIQKTSAAYGYKIYYPYPGEEHSGIITGIYNGGTSYSDIEVTSKWGGYGLVRHRANNCPYYVGVMPLRYYSRF